VGEKLVSRSVTCDGYTFTVTHPLVTSLQISLL